MIVPTYNLDDICRELMEDHHWITDDARSRFKKELKRLQASGMSSKTIEYQPDMPSRNRWYVSATLFNRKERPIAVSGCCAVETEYGVKNYYVILGRHHGRRHYAKITSHVVKRIKERKPEFRGMTAGQICIRIFSRDHGGFYTPNSVRFSDSIDALKCDSVISTKAGVFLGTVFMHLHHTVYLLQTFLHPDMLYTHEQQALYDYHLKSIKFAQHFKIDWSDGEMKLQTCFKHWREKRQLIDWFSGIIEEEHSAYETYLIPPME